MSEDSTSSDTLRDRLEKAGRRDTEHERSGLRKRVAEDAIEYAAHLERDKHDLMSELQDSEEGIILKAVKEQRDEARAERDRLLRFLEDLEEWLDGKGGSNPIRPYETDQLTQSTREVLREVERGDTVDQIRHDFAEEIVERLRLHAETRGEDMGAPYLHMANEVLTLAEGDDQEDD